MCAPVVARERVDHEMHGLGAERETQVGAVECAAVYAHRGVVAAPGEMHVDRCDVYGTRWKRQARECLQSIHGMAGRGLLAPGCDVLQFGGLQVTRPDPEKGGE